MGPITGAGHYDDDDDNDDHDHNHDDEDDHDDHDEKYCGHMFIAALIQGLF